MAAHIKYENAITHLSSWLVKVKSVSTTAEIRKSRKMTQYTETGAISTTYKTIVKSQSIASKPQKVNGKRSAGKIQSTKLETQKSIQAQ